MVTNEKDDTKYWRCIACVLSVVWGVLFFFSIHFYIQGYTEKDILTPTSTIVLYGFTILGCLLLAISPLQFYIYTFLCCLWGVINIVEGGSALGVLMYGLGLFFALKKGFFATRWKLKLSLASIPLIVALCSQFRYGWKTFLGSFIDILGLFIIMAIVVFLARHELQNLRKNKTPSMDMQQLPSAKVLTLPRDKFKRKDVAIAQGILEGKKYLAIANEQNMGLSSLKRRAKMLFTYVNVTNGQSFIATYEDCAVELENSEPFMVSMVDISDI
jgi:hypothetical protein